MHAQVHECEKAHRTPLILTHMLTSLHSPEEVASDPRILRWVMFFPYLSLASLNGLVL